MMKFSSLDDQPNSFGWISIALHWTTSLALISLWFIGQSLAWLDPQAVDARRSLHILLGLIAWLPLMARIVWRYLQGHPKVLGQSALISKLARLNQNLMLGCVLVMIITGPVMAGVGAWNLADSIAVVALWLHAKAAILLALLVVAHISGALKHLMFNDDETLARIFVPRAVTVKAKRSSE